MKISTSIKLTSTMVLVLAVLTFLSLYFLDQSINEENQVVEKKIEFKQLGNDLMSGSDYLTNEVRSYVQYGEKQHYDNYWREVNETKTRDHSIKRLEELGAPEELLSLVKEAKEKSDTLAKLEDEAMKAAERKDFDKARALVFGNEYEEMKSSIANKIKEFATKLNQQAEQASTEAQNATHLFLFVSNVLTVITVAAMMLTFIYLYRKIVHPLGKLTAVANQVAKGDLRVDKSEQSSSNDEVSVLSQAINEMVKNLQGIIQQVNVNGEQVAASSEQLTASSEQSTKAAEQITTTTLSLAEGSEEQLRSIDHVSNTISQMSARIQEIAANSEKMSELAEGAVASSDEGSTTVETVLKNMNEINETVQNSGKVIRTLGNRSQEIGKIVGAISDIATQTNLLALNAAIESARAGEHGKGFAVVADEVRKLAEQSKKSAEQIASVLEGFQYETQEAVQSIESGTEKVLEGLESAQRINVVFQDIKHSITNVNHTVTEVTASIEHMAEGSEQIVEAVEIIKKAAEEGSKASQENSAAIEEQLATMQEVASSAQSLSYLASELQESVTKFKL
ncbi:methyl-accepting chemotaxis protein [Brevibacillus ginsengisoli]|uniref:methyl-accepting chemotaxis protein n=1 Tax=Brevibacillus ginsengisoli TaxID=363854 RepID=UPI003CE6E505